MFSVRPASETNVQMLDTDDTMNVSLTWKFMRVETVNVLQGR